MKKDFFWFSKRDLCETALVASPDGGPLHDVQWNPTQDEFVMLHGAHPCAAGLYEGRKGSKRMDFGTGHRNTIRRAQELISKGILKSYS